LKELKRGACLYRAGANVWAAIQRARIIGSGKKIVTIIVDSGLKYLNGDLYT